MDIVPSKRKTRRKLLASLGIGVTVSSAGCQGVLNNPSMQSSKNSSGTPSPDSKGRGDSSSSGDGVASKTFTAKTIEDFKNISQWKAVTGSVKQANTSSGKALRMTGNPSAGDKLWARKKGLDWNLKDKNLSFALNIKKPKVGQNVIVTMRLHAPDADNTMTVGELVRVLPGQGRFRIDAGPRKISGIPKLSQVTAVDVMVQPPQGGQTDVQISDIRAVNSFDQGYIALTFDDSRQSQYKAHKILKKNNVPGTLSVITGKIGKKGYLNKSQLKEMQKGGWDFATHSSGETPLTEMSTSAMWQALIDARDWMVNNGFEKKNSKKAFVYPSGRWDDESVQYLNRYFNSGYRYLSYVGAMTGPITDPWTISRGDGTAGIEYIRPQINIASMFKELMILTFHDIGTGRGMSISEKELEQIISYGKQRGMKFITLTDIEENMMATMK